MTVACLPPDFRSQQFIETGEIDADKLTPTGRQNKRVGGSSMPFTHWWYFNSAIGF